MWRRYVDLGKINEMNNYHTKMLVELLYFWGKRAVSQRECIHPCVFIVCLSVLISTFSYKFNLLRAAYTCRLEIAPLQSLLHLYDVSIITLPLSSCLSLGV